MFKGLLSDLLSSITNAVQSPTTRSIVMGWVRHGASYGAGYLVAEGVIQHAQADEVTGAIALLGAVALSGIQKILTSRKIAAAAATAPAKQGA